MTNQMDIASSKSSSQEIELEEPFEDESSAKQMEEIFGKESDEDVGGSSVGSVKSIEVVEDAEHPILPTKLDPPDVPYSEYDAALPVEFELGDPISLQFPVASVQHETSNVSLLAPGEWISIEPNLFDESKTNGFVESAAYNKRVIRWRKTEGGKLESNSRLIEWDDGSFSLFVEGKCFDLGKEVFLSGTELLCIDQQNCLQALHAVCSRLYAGAMPSDESDEDAEMQSVVQEVRKPKTKRVTVLSNPVKDREEKLKKLEEERRDRELMERRQRQINEKISLPTFEHFEEEEEEDYAAKEALRMPQRRTRPSRRQPARSKKKRLDEFEEDFIAEEEEEEEVVELGEDFEEEIEDVDDEEEEDEEEGEKSESEDNKKSKSESEDSVEVSPPQKKQRRTETEEKEIKPMSRSVFLSEEYESDESED